jgi:threonine/homoserine/homoserine lactone efflux protein
MSLSFLLTSLIVVVSPGTGVLYTLAVALTRGSRASVAAAFGCTLGILPHMLAAMLGLAAVLHTSALAFSALKWCGVVYLLYMAWQTLGERGALAVDTGIDEAKQRRVVVTGFLINILNPKLSIFFLAFLPQFIDPDSSTKIAAFIALGLTFIATGTAWCLFLAIAAASVRRFFIGHPKAFTRLSQAAGTLFIGLGIRLAVAER